MVRSFNAQTGQPGSERPPLIETFRDPGRRLAMRASLLDLVPRLGPAQVGIIPTYRCDYGCVFCALQLDRAAGRPELDVGVFATLLEDLVRLGTPRISLTGGGDPSVHPRFPELLDLARRSGLRHIVSTHGRWLTQGGAAWLGPAAELHVGLNAATAATYDRVHRLRAPGTFEALCAALGEFAGRAGARPVGSVSLSFIFCRENAAEIRGFYDLARGIGADNVVYRMIIPHPKYEHLLPTADQIVAAFADVAAVRRQAERPGNPAVVFGDNFLPPRTNGERVLHTLRRLTGQARESTGLRRVLTRYRAWTWKTTGPIPCLEGFANAYVDSDGTVFACHGGGPRQPTNVMGRLVEERFPAIWGGERYREFRRKTRRINTGIAGNSLFPDEDVCLRCPKRDLFADLLATVNLTPRELLALDGRD